MFRYSSKLIEDAITEISKIPGIGKKSALRIVLFILKQHPQYVEKLSSAINKLRKDTLYCDICHNISEQKVETITNGFITQTPSNINNEGADFETPTFSDKTLNYNPTCNICANPNRNKSIICVVGNIQDVIAIENTSQYSGLYHVLGGTISPILGIGPENINVESLLERIRSQQPRELIFALKDDIEGDATSYYIKKKIINNDLKTTIISKGIPIGGEIEYTDEATLAKSLMSRIPYDIAT